MIARAAVAVVLMLAFAVASATPAAASATCKSVKASGQTWGVAVSGTGCKKGRSIGRKFLKRSCPKDGCTRRIRGWKCTRSFELTGGCRKGKAAIDLLRKT